MHQSYTLGCRIDRLVVPVEDLKDCIERVGMSLLSQEGKTR
jgi:hypothetical protein